MNRQHLNADRRTVLKATGSAALAATAGCLGALSSEDGNDDVVLGPPENHDRRKSLDIPYPTYGEQIPDATVPAPLHDRSVSTTEFVGDRHVMMTFIYTSCQTVCPGLTASLRQVQADSIDEEYADEIAFLPTTFDPEQDTAPALRSYGEEMGVNFEVGNWYFLRPETPDEAKRVVEETFGVAFQSAGDGHTEGSSDDEEMLTMFQHSSVVLLVNKDGFVERAYNGGPPGPGEAIKDTQTVVEGW
jgi:protein SCO1/2